MTDGLPGMRNSMSNEYVTICMDGLWNVLMATVINCGVLGAFNVCTVGVLSGF
jgi:hypothetical protein